MFGSTAIYSPGNPGIKSIQVSVASIIFCRIVSDLSELRSDESEVSMSPVFPGMDPYLEKAALWPAFHSQMMAMLYQTVLPSLVDRYRARIKQRLYTTEMPLFTSVVKEDHREDYLEIRLRSDDQLITLIEVVSIANKTTPLGRQKYHETRSEALRERASIVEIDLLTQGQPTLDFSRENLPEHHQLVCVSRGNSPSRYEIYTATVQSRLPKFKLPLAADDRDTVLDLQLVFTRAYEKGQFFQRIDYRQPLPAEVVYDSPTRNWIQEWLSKQNLGQPD